MGETGSHQSRTINIMNMRDYFGRQNRPLHAILDQVKRFGAADPRDKMWALLNFPEFQREAPDLAPSYDITPSEAYAAVTLATIRYSGNLHVLTRVDREANLLVEPFSSWIPRWDCKDVAPNVWPTSYGQFSAGTSSSAPRLNLHVLAGNILKLGGVQFDVVEDVSCIDCAGYNASPPLKPKFLSKREWERYTEPSEEPYPTSAAITEAYAMTLTAGHHEYQGSNVVPASRCVQKHVVEFIAWLQWLREEHGANEDSRIPKECHYPPGFYSETRPFLPEYNLKTIAEHAMHFHDMVRFYSCYQTLFRTKRGYLGMGSYGPRPGDLVCVFFGGALPFILRQRNGGDGYELVGSAYVHGVMNGEAIDMFHKGKLSAQSFDIH